MLYLLPFFVSTKKKNSSFCFINNIVFLLSVRTWTILNIYFSISNQLLSKNTIVDIPSLSCPTRKSLTNILLGEKFDQIFSLSLRRWFCGHCGVSSDTFQPNLLGFSLSIYIYIIDQIWEVNLLKISQEFLCWILKK